jgi:hypothetical protein
MMKKRREERGGEGKEKREGGNTYLRRRDLSITSGPKKVHGSVKTVKRIKPINYSGPFHQINNCIENFCTHY